MEADVAGEQKYLRAALLNQYNVILAIGAIAFAVALASWLPVLVGLLGEAAWLFLAPRLDSFRQSADANVARADNAKVIETLSPEYAQRVASVESDAAEIQALCAGRPDLSADQKQEVARRVRPAVQTFIDVCVTHEQLRKVTAHAPINELQAEVSGLLQSLSTETDIGVRASLRRSLSAAERRIKQFDGNDSAARSLDLALASMQKGLAMLKEGAAGLSTGPELCAELDAATTQLIRTAAQEAERGSELTGAPVNVLPPALS